MHEDKSKFTWIAGTEVNLLDGGIMSFQLGMSDVSLHIPDTNGMIARSRSLK